MEKVVFNALLLEYIVLLPETAVSSEIYGKIKPTVY